jgi:hypothetical protein
VLETTPHVIEIEYFSRANAYPNNDPNYRLCRTLTAREGIFMMRRDSTPERFPLGDSGATVGR